MSRFEINPDTREPYPQQPSRVVRGKQSLGGPGPETSQSVQSHAAPAQEKPEVPEPAPDRWDENSER